MPFNCIRFHATDDRDRLFAVLGFVREFAAVDALPKLFAPDYSKTTGRAFSDFTRWVISAQESLDILSFVTPEVKYKEGLPSWVPDYAGSIPNIDRTSGLFSDYDANAGLKPVMRKTQHSVPLSEVRHHSENNASGIALDDHVLHHFTDLPMHRRKSSSFLYAKR